MGRQQAHLRIEGDVQGVGFRWHTRNKARELRIVGWVRNLPDGAVEAVAEGEGEDLAAFIAWCRQGPPSARVTDLGVVMGELSGFVAFEIRR